MDSSRRTNPTVRRVEFARFEAFYDFAFPRVYRFAQGRTDTEDEAKMLCRLILTQALTSIGGRRVDDPGSHGQPTDLALWLYSVACRVADEFAARPTHRAQSDLDDGIAIETPQSQY